MLHMDFYRSIRSHMTLGTPMTVRQGCGITGKVKSNRGQFKRSWGISEIMILKQLQDLSKVKWQETVPVWGSPRNDGDFAWDFLGSNWMSWDFHRFSKSCNIQDFLVNGGSQNEK